MPVFSPPRCSIPHSLVRACISVCAAMVAAVPMARASEQWSDTIPGPTNTVRALTIHEGRLIAGGGFHTVGAATVNYVAAFDGANWAALGGGLNSGTAYALASSGGQLFAGGNFSGTEGNAAAARLAPWNGTTWLPGGIGSGSLVYALCPVAAGVAVGGYVNTLGGVPVSNIGMDDGLAWSALSAGTGPGVTGLLAAGTDLYVGGTFSSARGQTARGVARWGGVGWESLGTGLSGSGVEIDAMTVYQGDLVVGGRFQQAGALPVSNLARWVLSAPSAVAGA